MSTKIKTLKDTIKYYFDYHIFISLFIIISIIIIILTIMLVAFHEFDSIYTAIWWLIITAMTTEPGYADMYPGTILGYIIQFLIIILGLGIFGSFIAKLTGIFNINTKKREMGNMSVPFHQHLIICGWSNKTKPIIKEILAEPKRKYNYIVLVADIDSDPFPENKNIVFVRGKIDDADTLQRANIKCAEKVIILNEDNDDSTTALAAVIINEMNNNIYSIAEVSDVKNEKYFKAAGVKQTIINNTFNSNLLVRTALYEETAEVIRELLTNEEGNEIYIDKVENEHVGKSFIDLMNEYKNSEKDITLIGVKTKKDNGISKITTNPNKDYIFKKGDKIIYIGKENKTSRLLFLPNM